MAQRLEGVVCHGIKDRYCMLSVGGGTKYLFHQKEWPLDSIGRAYVKPGEWFSFELGDDGSHGLRVTKAKLLSDRQRVPPDYRETGTVLLVDSGGSCFLRRPSFDQDIFMSKQSLMTPFEVGQRWSYKVVASKRKRDRWQGINPRIENSENESTTVTAQTPAQIQGQQSAPPADRAHCPA